LKTRKLIAALNVKTVDRAAFRQRSEKDSVCSQEFRRLRVYAALQRQNPISLTSSM
jgi:hypothetical protein